MTNLDEAAEQAAARLAAIQAAGPLLPEQPDPRPAALPYVAPLPYAGQTVDPGAQALVWALTASEHAAGALTALTELEDLREGQHADPDRMGLLIRKAEYHSKSRSIASETAGMWALVNSTTLPDEWNADESGEDGKTHADD